jgi:small subunit ribosomal protein S4
MLNYIGSRSKIIRYLGLLPGLTQKVPQTYSKTPGQHGKTLNKNIKSFNVLDDYKVRLIQKQLLKFNYNITEKQLFSYYKQFKLKNYNKSEYLLTKLEMRLDSIIYRAGFTKTIPEARQLIIHNHVFVNNKKINTPSFICDIGNVISFSINIIPKLKIIIENIKNLNKTYTNKICPLYLKIDYEKFIINIKNKAKRTDILLDVDELKVIEYYAK